MTGDTFLHSNLAVEPRVLFRDNFDNLERKFYHFTFLARGTTLTAV